MSRATPRFRRTNALLPQPTGNIYRVKVFGTIEGQLTMSVFFYQDTLSIGSPLSMSTVASQWNTTNMAAYKGAVSADWTASKVTCDSPNNPAVATGTQTVTGAGTGPAGHEPTEVAAIVTRVSTVKGQCGRGRLGLPAVPTAWVTASNITTLTGYTPFVNGPAFNNLVVGANTLTIGIFSRGNRLTKQNGFSAIVSTALNTLLGTIRRRRIGRGK